ncbi:MAG: 30S ribosomal protein S6 [Parcubacteria group bacterium]|nr:30S ribosomal protein S6 [Parcubacteria group bacterium]
MAEEIEKTGEEMDEDIDGAESRVYELSYLIVPTVKVDDLESEVAKIKAVLAEVHGTVISEDAPKDIELSYEMRKGQGGKYEKFNRAYFGWIKFEAIGGSAVALGVELKKSDTILRSLIIKTVRESTLATMRIAPQLDSTTPTAAPVKKMPVKRVEGKSVPVSEAELDKSIKELVVE